MDPESLLVLGLLPCATGEEIEDKFKRLKGEFEEAVTVYMRLQEKHIDNVSLIACYAKLGFKVYRSPNKRLKFHGLKDEASGLAAVEQKIPEILFKFRKERDAYMKLVSPGVPPVNPFRSKLAEYCKGFKIPYPLEDADADAALSELLQNYELFKHKFDKRRLVLPTHEQLRHENMGIGIITASAVVVNYIKRRKMNLVQLGEEDATDPAADHTSQKNIEGEAVPSEVNIDKEASRSVKEVVGEKGVAEDTSSAVVTSAGPSEIRREDSVTPDHYAILGLSSKLATLTDIHERYIGICKRYIDSLRAEWTVSVDLGIEDIYTKASLAHKVLADPITRKHYDDTLKGVERESLVATPINTL